jgi:hypothetical protein
MLYPPAKICRHGTREACPVAKCRFQHSYIIYSSGLKGAAPPPPTPVTSPTRTHFSSTEQATLGWCGDGKVHAQHIRPSIENAVLAQGPRDLNGSATTPFGAFDANALAQGTYFPPICLRYEVCFLGTTADIFAATDGLAMYRAWLESQVEVQKAKIQAMSKQYSISIPQLDLDPLDFPPLRMIPPNMANTRHTTVTVPSNFRGQQPEVPSLEPMQPFPRAPTHIPRSESTKSQYYHEGSTPPGAAAHDKLNSSTTAPRKVDMSFKTTPCRHFTLNRGWCPWGDECCLYVPYLFHNDDKTE